MTLEIALVLGILIAALILFVTEWVRMDVVALLVLGALALTGIVGLDEALAGFSNPAVITVWAVFIISGALYRTGIAVIIGNQVMKVAGDTEARIVAVIMTTAAVMSAFMNNVGVAALMLPVVMDIARRTGRAPSRLLMPLAFGSLLGGLTTLIGTPPNILVSDALREAGHAPFQLFDYTPVGLAVMLVGIAFMTLVGRHLLPRRDVAKETSSSPNLAAQYELGQRMLVLRLPADSTLAGRTLAESRFGSALGLQVIAIDRNGKTQLAPSAGAVLQPGDRLTVQGRLDHLQRLHGWRELEIEEDPRILDHLATADVGVAEVIVRDGSALHGRSIAQLEFRQRFGANVVAIRRDGLVSRSNLQNRPLQTGDRLLVLGPREKIDALASESELVEVEGLSDSELTSKYKLHDRLFILRVPEEFLLSGESLRESRMGDALGLSVLGIVRDDGTRVLPGASDTLVARDSLVVEGRLEDVAILRGLQQLEVEREVVPETAQLESERVALGEVMLSPHTTLVRRTLREISFREKFGLTVLALWREGSPYPGDLRDVELRFGDALLVYGPREKLMLLGREPDFLVLTQAAQEVPRRDKALWAALILAGVLVPVILGYIHISIAAVVGATLMVLVRCLTMEEAYRFIEWRAVFLIAGMLPLGTAMAKTGAAHWLAEGVVATAGGYGPIAVVASLYVMTAIATAAIPSAALVVLMSPIVLSAASSLNLSHHALMMALAMASVSLASPVSHPANTMMMGPGGYRFVDYLKVGIPLTLVVLATVLLVLPLFWPLRAN